MAEQGTAVRGAFGELAGVAEQGGGVGGVAGVGGGLHDGGHAGSGGGEGAGHGEQQRPAPGDDHAPAGEHEPALQHRLRPAGSDDPGQGPAGEGQLPLVGPGGEQDGAGPDGRGGLVGAGHGVHDPARFAVGATVGAAPGVGVTAGAEVVGGGALSAGGGRAEVAAGGTLTDGAVRAEGRGGRGRGRGRDDRPDVVEGEVGDPAGRLVGAQGGFARGEGGPPVVQGLGVGRAEGGRRVAVVLPAGPLTRVEEGDAQAQTGGRDGGREAGGARADDGEIRRRGRHGRSLPGW